MSTLAYADEVIDPAEIDELQGLDDVDVSSKEVAMAASLVDSLAAAFEPEKYRDEYREQVLDLIQIKASGQEFTALEAPVEKPKVVDLMAALEASVRAAKEARGRHPAAKAAPAADPADDAADDEPARRNAPKKATKSAPKKTAAKKAAAKKAAAKKAAAEQPASKKAAATKAAAAPRRKSA